MNERVLIADCDDRIKDMLREALEGAGFEPVFVPREEVTPGYIGAILGPPRARDMVDCLILGAHREFPVLSVAEKFPTFSHKEFMPEPIDYTRPERSKDKWNPNFECSGPTGHPKRNRREIKRRRKQR